MDTRFKTAVCKLLKESDLDASIRLLDAVRDSLTCRTPPVPVLAAPDDKDDDATRAVRTKYEEDKDIIGGVYSEVRHRKWAKAIRQHRLGDDYSGDAIDVSKLAKVIVALMSELTTASLGIDVFDLDHPTPGAQRFVNELVYDTLTYIIKPDTVAYGYLLGADSAFDRDG
ncbi:hypothetical protein CYMTET_12613 [Cymbomonas tetramitiformis]|uniref:Uncharacterized protein n=1 Tax=Cymbomonas tetramitiformis TaxID=36881 RepID=A0AAE0GKC1_9CHLO|nr:hypothetical protein CYMTET_12613 [Cymbomonas tetramitiformis]